MDVPKIVSASGHLPFEARSTPRSMRAGEERSSDIFRSAWAPSNSPGVPQTRAATIITEAGLTGEGQCARSRSMILHYIPIEQATMETQCERGVRSQVIWPLVEQWMEKVRTSVIGSVIAPRLLFSNGLVVCSVRIAQGEVSPVRRTGPASACRKGLTTLRDEE